MAKEYRTGLPEHAYRYFKMTEFGISTLYRYLLFSHVHEQSLEPVPESVKNAYAEYRPLIEKIYGDDHMNQELLYHGTGRYHYTQEGKHKYEVEESATVEDVLEVLLQKGLEPRLDIWVPTPASHPTVSLTHQRFYARWYADKHNFNDLEWSFGDPLNWSSSFVVKNIGKVSHIPYIALLMKNQVKRKKGGLLGAVHDWVGDARDDVDGRTGYQEALKTKSTIPGNYGITLVMDDSSVENYDFPLLHRTEVRTLHAIPPKSLKAIEVPLKQVQETEEKIRGVLSLDIPVIPTECVDYHMSKFPMRELTRIDKKDLVKKPNIELENISGFDYFPLTGSDMEKALADINDDFDVLKIIELLDSSPLLNSLLSQDATWEGFSIRYHVMSVLLLFEKYYPVEQDLPGNIDRNFFRVFLALHDIGDSLGKSTKEKLAFNREITVDLLTKMNFPEDQIRLARAMLSNDPIGSYLKHVGVMSAFLDKSPAFLQYFLSGKFDRTYRSELAKTKAQLNDMASDSGLSIDEFTELMILFHTFDAGAYTTEGGTLGSLDYVFHVDPEKKQFMYSSEIQEFIDLLKES